MRKDYHFHAPDANPLAEIDRVEQHWTTVWEQTGGVTPQAYDWVKDAEYYRLMQPYLRQIAAGGRVLDAGCGRGEWVLYLDSLGYETHGVDISQVTIDALNDRFPQAHFMRADIRDLPYADDYFDLVFSWGVFEHFEDGLGACINEARRVLRPGGWLVITVPYHNLRHHWRDRRPFAQWMSEQGTGIPHFDQWRLTLPELERELALRGFAVHETRPAAFEHGLSRALRHDLHLDPSTRTFRRAQRILKRMIPARWVSHMAFAAGQKIQP